MALGHQLLVSEVVNSLVPSHFLLKIHFGSAGGEVVVVSVFSCVFVRRCIMSQDGPWMALCQQLEGSRRSAGSPSRSFGERATLGETGSTVAQGRPLADRWRRKPNVHDGAVVAVHQSRV